MRNCVLQCTLSTCLLTNYQCKGQRNKSQMVKLCWSSSIPWPSPPNPRRKMDLPLQSSSHHCWRSLVSELLSWMLPSSLSLVLILAPWRLHCSWQQLGAKQCRVLFPPVTWKCCKNWSIFWFVCLCSVAHEILVGMMLWILPSRNGGSVSLEDYLTGFLANLQGCVSSFLLLKTLAIRFWFNKYKSKVLEPFA